MHYHYAQERNVPVFITRPLVNSNIKPDQPANVGVKVVGDVALNVDVSMKTMRDFIYPFARALDLINTRSAESQTSYVSTHAITDAYSCSFMYLSRLHPSASCVCLLLFVE